MLDLERLDEIADGDQQLKDELLSLFFQSTREDLLNLKAAVNNRRYDQVTGIAHRIKGSTAMIGAEQLSELAQRMESAGHQADGNLCLHAFEVLSSDFRALEQSFPSF